MAEPRLKRSGTPCGRPGAAAARSSSSTSSRKRLSTNCPSCTCKEYRIHELGTVHTLESPAKLHIAPRFRRGFKGCAPSSARGGVRQSCGWRPTPAPSQRPPRISRGSRRPILPPGVVVSERAVEWTAAAPPPSQVAARRGDNLLAPPVQRPASGHRPTAHAATTTEIKSSQLVVLCTYIQMSLTGAACLRAAPRPSCGGSRRRCGAPGGP